MEWAKIGIPVVAGAVLLIYLLSRSKSDPCALNPNRLKHPTGGRKKGFCS